MEEVEDEPIVTSVVKAEGRKANNTKSVKKGKSKAQNQAEYTCEADFDRERSFEELHFMLFCFFKDLNDVRQHLRSNVWAQYNDGEMLLMTASVVTDLAIDVVKRRERALLDTEVNIGGKQSTFAEAVGALQRAQTQRCAIILVCETTHDYEDWW